jgi:cytochrome c-type biogenesis protein CcmH
VVRERLVAGDTDAQVHDYVVARYGEFVLLRPVFAWHTMVLWIAAPVVLIAGIVAVFLALRRRGRSDPPPEKALTSEENAALDSLKGP